MDATAPLVHANGFFSNPPPPPKGDDSSLGNLGNMVLIIGAVLLGVIVCCCCFPAFYRRSRQLCKTYGDPGWPGTAIADEMTPLTEPEESALGWVRWMPGQGNQGSRWTRVPAPAASPAADAPDSTEDQPAPNFFDRFRRQQPSVEAAAAPSTADASRSRSVARL